MSRRHLLMLGTLAAIWGASFLLIEIALRDLAPTTLIAGRILFAAATLLVIAPLRVPARTLARELRGAAGPLAALGLLNSTVPFLLIAWGQQYIDSGVAAILNASAPLFTALLALALGSSQRVTGLRLAGFVVGFAGVALLAGVNPSGGERGVVGSAAVVAAGLLYAVGALYAGRKLATVSPLVVSLGSMLWASAFALPLGLWGLRTSEASWAAAGSVLVLGVVATGVAYLLYFGLIAGAGASRAILVTYLVPALALVYGVVLLDERLSAAAVGGLALVLGGVALGTGTVRARRAARLAA